MREVAVQFILEADRVLGEEQCVHVEAERDRRPAELDDAIERFETAGEPHLDDTGPKAPRFEIT